MPEDLVMVFALCVGVSDTELETLSVVIYFPNPEIICTVDFLLSYQRWCERERRAHRHNAIRDCMWSL